MKLAIALAAASVILRFSTPGPGSYYVVTGPAGSSDLHIEASNHEPYACHVAVQLPRTEDHALFWVFFAPNNQNPRPVMDYTITP